MGFENPKWNNNTGQMPFEIENLTQNIDAADFAGIRVQTEETLATDMAEMQVNMERGGILIPSAQCEKDLHRIPHFASEYGELVYQSMLGERSGSSCDERIGIRQKLLQSYLSDLPVAVRMKTMALLTQTMFNEIHDLVQMGIRRWLDDGYSVVRLGMDDRHIAMNKEDRGVTMTFTLYARLSLLSTGVLGSDISDKGEAAISGSMQAVIDPDGDHLLLPPVISLRLTNVVESLYTKTGRYRMNGICLPVKPRQRRC